MHLLITGIATVIYHFDSISKNRKLPKVSLMEIIISVCMCFYIQRCNMLNKWILSNIHENIHTDIYIYIYIYIYIHK